MINDFNILEILVCVTIIISWQQVYFLSYLEGTFKTEYVCPTTTGAKHMLIKYMEKFILCVQFPLLQFI